MTNFREIDVAVKYPWTPRADATKVQAELERANRSRHEIHRAIGSLYNGAAEIGRKVRQLTMQVLRHEQELDDMADWADDVNQRLSALETGSTQVRVDDHSTIDVTVQDPRVSDLQQQIDGLRTVLIQRVEELRAVDRHSSDRIDAATRRLNTAEVNVADTHLLARDNERRLDKQVQARTPAQRVANALRSEARRGGYLSAAAMEAMADTLDGKE